MKSVNEVFNTKVCTDATSDHSGSSEEATDQREAFNEDLVGSAQILKVVKGYAEPSVV